MTRKKLPFVSVVIPSYNEEAHLGEALDSLLAQTYPKNRFEIIVVDDGSTDNTAEVAAGYPSVRYVKLPKNQGIAGARNAGLHAARGTIYVSFDADCKADSRWLSELIAGYKDSRALGVGGRTVEPEPIKRVAMRYISMCDTLFAPQQDSSQHKSPLRRLIGYVKSRVRTSIPDDNLREASELYGASASFPRRELRAVGGWDVKFTGIEDRDLSLRLTAAFPDRPFYVAPKALLVHERGESLVQYLRRPVRRGVVNYNFHRQNNMAPPIFPFPILYALICLASLFISPLVFLACLVLMPQLLYFWWPFKLLQVRRPTILFFPYIQMGEEVMTIVGLARGFLVELGQRTRKYVPKLLVFCMYAALVAGFAVSSLLMPDGRLREIITTLWVLLVPGISAWQALAGSKGPRITFSVCGYMLGLSLLLLMVLGLALNQSYVFIGANRPFERLPLTVAVGSLVLVCGAIAAARTTRLPKWSFAPKRLIKRLIPNPLVVAVLLSGLLLPVLSILGANTLNNGGSAGLSILTMGATAAFFLLLLLRERDLGRFYGFGLYCMCVSILFASSMRGWNITGHDVMEEYQVFQLTLSHATWHMSYYHDAYTACLSITILPTIIQKISGIYAPYVYKFVFQAIAATLAVILYGSLRPFTNRRNALLAAFLFITFPTFLTDMSMLNRQEIGLLFFALVLHAGTTNKALGRRLRSGLAFLFMVGMILSHYSTSYVAIGAFLVSIAGAYFWKYGAHLLRRKNVPHLPAFTSIVSPAVLAASVLVLIGWGAIATQTSNNIQQTIQSIVATAEGKSQPTGSLNQASSEPTASSFSKEVETTRPLPAIQYYSNAAVQRNPLQTARETIQPETSIASRLHLPTPLLQKAYDLMHSGYELLIIGTFAIGLGYCIFKKRTQLSPPRQYLLVAVGTLVLIALQVAFPSAINYGVTRMLQQALVVFALPSILAALWILRIVRIPERVAEVITGAVLVVFFLVLGGALPALTGGYKPSLTTASDGFYYAAYYMHQDEVAASQWLAHDTPKGSRVYTDEFMRRKLITYGGIFSQPVVIPAGIPTDSYVMLSHGNIEFNQVPAYDGGTLIYYKPPMAFLNQQKNLVYSSGDVQIYK